MCGARVRMCVCVCVCVCDLLSSEKELTGKLLIDPSPALAPLARCCREPCAGGGTAASSLLVFQGQHACKRKLPSSLRPRRSCLNPLDIRQLRLTRRSLRIG